MGTSQSLGIKNINKDEFVEVELFSSNNEWWTNPESWKLNIRTTILPDWFKINKEQYLKKFKNAVEDWWSEHVLINKKIDNLYQGEYWLYNCDIREIWWNAHIIVAQDTTIWRISCDVVVQEMRGNSILKEWKMTQLYKICVIILL